MPTKLSVARVGATAGATRLFGGKLSITDASNFNKVNTGEEGKETSEIVIIR